VTDLQWPDGFDRTPAGERQSYPGGFEVSRRKAFNSILEELGKMDAVNVDVQTAAPHTTRNPNLPYKDPVEQPPGQRPGDREVPRCQASDRALRRRDRRD